MKRTLLTLLLGALFTSTTSFADTTYVSGYVSGDWTTEGSPYIAISNIQVAADSELTIHPGVEVLFEGPDRFALYGRFTALGTAEASILFGAELPVNPRGWYGFYINPRQDTVRYAHCTFRDVRPLDWNGALIAFEGFLELDHCQIVGAAGLHLDSTVADLRYTSITGPGPTGYSVGFYARYGSMLKLTGCEIASHRWIDGPGGWVESRSTLIADSCWFHHNDGDVWGGALFLENGVQVELLRCTFSDNEAAEGGAIRVMGSPGGEVVIDRCLFLNNGLQEGYYGGAINRSSNSGSLTITRSTFYGNRAPHGGSAVLSNSGVTINSCIFARQVGSAAIQLNGTGSVDYCDFWENTADMGGSGTLPRFGSQDSLNRNGDPCDDYFNLFQSPEFADTLTFSLLSGSPCIDAGDSLLSFDPDSTIADMGWQYFDQTSSSGSGFILHPSSLILLSAFPNPFNSTTTISFEIPVASRVALKVFDLQGRTVAVLADEAIPAGRHTLRWTAANLSSGMYFVSLASGGNQKVEKLLLLQ